MRHCDFSPQHEFTFSSFRLSLEFFLCPLHSWPGGGARMLSVCAVLMPFRASCSASREMLPPYNGTQKTPLFYLNQGRKARRGLSTNLICLVLCRCCSSLPGSLTPSLSLFLSSPLLPPTQVLPLPPCLLHHHLLPSHPSCLPRFLLLTHI